ncbi:MAG: DUF6600 domain-containing protein [Verrucomicrobiota bacterium]|nr:DUF6600 domain-containing protein [Verrucomicrobiota bacterium]
MKPVLTRALQYLTILSAAILFQGCEVEGGDAAAPSDVSTTVTATNSVTQTNATVANTQTTIINAAPAPVPPPTVDLSAPVLEIIKLAQANVGDSVLLAFIAKSENAFDLDADDILYLTDLGISDEVLAAMLNKEGKSLEAFSPSTNAIAATPPAGPQPAPEPQVEVTTNYVAIPGAVSTPAPTVSEQPSATEVIATAPPVQQVTYSYFYSSLSPYGTWVEVPEYGYVWQPTVAVVDTGWRPYVNRGRWLYSDAGWYWHSDYSWGWAPFHYGRWACPPGRGWIWIPDTTWGPSWVSWRYSRGYCGWAPLPPAACYRPGIGFTYYNSRVAVSFGFGLGYSDYCFVPTARFCDPRPWRHRVPYHQNNTIYKDSTVINNYIVGNNNTIINEGISRDTIATASRTEIRKVSIRDVDAGNARTIRPNQIASAGGESVVYRPTPPAQQLQVADLTAARAEARRTAPARTLGTGPATTIAARPDVSGLDRQGGAATPLNPGASGSTPSIRPRPLPQAAATATTPATQFPARGSSETRKGGPDLAAGAISRQAAPAATPSTPSAAPSISARPLPVQSVDRQNSAVSPSTPVAVPSRTEPGRVGSGLFATGTAGTRTETRPTPQISARPQARPQITPAPAAPSIVQPAPRGQSEPTRQSVAPTTSTRTFGSRIEPARGAAVNQPITVTSRGGGVAPARQSVQTTPVTSAVQPQVRPTTQFAPSPAQSSRPVTSWPGAAESRPAPVAQPVHRPEPRPATRYSAPVQSTPRFETPRSAPAPVQRQYVAPEIQNSRPVSPAPTYSRPVQAAPQVQHQAPQRVQSYAPSPRVSPPVAVPSHSAPAPSSRPSGSVRPAPAPSSDSVPASRR